jgi:MFS family permease
VTSQTPRTRADILVGARSFFTSGVPATVWFLGLTSFLTDISSEMLVSVLPGYLVLHLGLTPFTFGVVDGLYHSLTSVARIASGMIADRWRRYKDVALVGYGISAAAKAILLIATSVPALGATIAIDRAGKGIRTAPRDAMIALSVEPRSLASAFGVHRALDTAGAALGPLMAFVVLASVGPHYDAVFVVSIAFAVMGVAALALLVHDPASTDRHRTVALTRSATMSELLSHDAFRSIVWVACTLAVATISDGFFYLVIQRDLAVNPTMLPLMFGGTAAAFFVFAVPFGRAADRYGRPVVFLGGYGLLMAAYAILLLPLPGPLKIGALVLVLGGYYAATDGVLAALISATVPSESRGTALAIVATGVTLCRFAASLLFGYLWTVFPTSGVVVVFAAGLVIALLMAARQLRSLTPRGEP